MEKTPIITQNAPAPIGPYSQAVRAGNTLYVSGQVAINPATGNIETNETGEQTQLVMKHLEAILQQAGLNFSHVVKSTIYCIDLGEFKAINEIYGGYFTTDPPARETVQVSALPKGARVEISVIAVYP